jgi:hypothetical protein
MRIEPLPPQFEWRPASSAFTASQEQKKMYEAENEPIEIYLTFFSQYEQETGTVVGTTSGTF